MNNSKNRIYAFFSYLPFFGWLVPMGLRKNDQFTLSHAKQGFVLAVFFTIFPIFLYLIVISFIPNNQRLAKFVVYIMIYLSHIVYFLICLFGFMLVKNNKFVLVPMVKKYYNKLDF